VTTDGNTTFRKGSCEARQPRQGRNARTPPA
jgi:hypothetical protein